jgi:hypothetical protein
LIRCEFEETTYPISLAYILAYKMPDGTQSDLQRIAMCLQILLNIQRAEQSLAVRDYALVLRAELMKEFDGSL